MVGVFNGVQKIPQPIPIAHQFADVYSCFTLFFLTEAQVATTITGYPLNVSSWWAYPCLFSKRRARAPLQLLRMPMANPPDTIGQ